MLETLGGCKYCREWLTTDLKSASRSPECASSEYHPTKGFASSQEAHVVCAQSLHPVASGVGINRLFSTKRGQSDSGHQPQGPDLPFYCTPWQPATYFEVYEFPIFGVIGLWCFKIQNLGFRLSMAACNALSADLRALSYAIDG